MASFAVSLLVAGTPSFAQQAKSAFAQQAKSAKPPAAKAAHSAVQQKLAHGKAGRGLPLPQAYAAIPEAERLAIQADLVWLGSYAGMSAEEVDGHIVDAIKSFQKRNNGKETGVLSDQERALLHEAAKARQAAVGWRLIEDTATGAQLGVPEKLVPSASTGRIGSRWASALGQIQIETFRLHEASLPALFEQEKKMAQRRIAYSALNPDSFVIIGEQRLKKFVVRAQSKDTNIRGVTILYDQATEGTMAPLAVAVADTFTGFPDPIAGSPPGARRSVEYATAIVATGRGELVTTDDVADGCQSITVPAFGHAERIAEDKTDNLALLRLYGARNLVPAPLAGDGSSNASDASLTLFGVADPLAPAGQKMVTDGMVTEVAAELTAQGLTPVPQLGFAGALAVDAQGRFAGIVALRSPVVAGTATARQAALVPAAALRAFLGAQRVVLASGPQTAVAQTAVAQTAMAQSVVQVICVRK